MIFSCGEVIMINPLFCVVYAGLFYAKYDGEIIMQESEVDDVYLKSFTEIVENDKDYTPDSVLAIKEVVKIKNLTV